MRWLQWPDNAAAATTLVVPELVLARQHTQHQQPAIHAGLVLQQQQQRSKRLAHSVRLAMRNMLGTVIIIALESHRLVQLSCKVQACTWHTNGEHSQPTASLAAAATSTCCERASKPNQTLCARLDILQL